MMRRVVLALLACLAIVPAASAHHVLGRPAYSLNEDSNTPPSMQVEARIGEYLVTTMVYPAFPRPGAPGRISLYVSEIESGEPYRGMVTFSVRDHSWWSWTGLDEGEIVLGRQPIDDNVFRQGFRIETAGDYIISAAFEAGGERHVLDFPLRVGAPPPIGPIGIAALGALLALIAVAVIQRRRALTGKIRAAHDRRR